jgi:hypothetical protein
MKAVAGIILFSVILVACGGGGSSSPDANVNEVSAPPTPDPAPQEDFPDYVLLDTTEVLNNVKKRLQGLGIDDFFEEVYRITAERDPEKVIADGLIDEFQLSVIELTNISDEYYFQTIAIQEAIVELLQGFDRLALTVDDQVSYDVHLAFLGLDIEGAKYRD